MPLGAREILLTIRARDLASQTLGSIITGLAGFAAASGRADAAATRAARTQMAWGAAMTTVGIGLAAAGAAGVAAAVNWTKAATEYDRQAAKTLTQVDNLKVSLSDVKEVAKRVATEVGVPFDQLQAGLYDIFSSMNVTVPQAEALLTSFSKEAVAGQTSLQDAGRATISVMNAWKLPATDVNHVLDVQFQLVRKGVGTFGEFATTIGRAIPSSVRASQSFETLAGMLAFMTRNGMSAAMAATSAARALDTMSNPLVLERLGKMGINVKDASGNLLPMITIVGQLNDKLNGLPPPEKGAILNSLFKNAGNTIQARRFFDLALNNFPLLTQMVGDMGNATGVFEQSYETMANTTATKTQLMKNNWDVLKVTLGDALIPVVNWLIEELTSLVKWFNDLSPTTKKWIAWIFAATSALTLLVGVVVALAGLWLMLTAAAALAGVGLATVGAIVAVVVLVIIAIGVAIWAVIKYHKQIAAAFVTAWTASRDFFINLWNTIANFFEGIWNSIYNTVASWLRSTKNFFVSGWNAVANFFISLWNSIANFFIGIWNAIYNAIATALSSIQNFFTTVWNAIAGFFVSIWNSIYNAVSSALSSIWDTITSVFNTISDFFWKYWRLALAIFTLGLSLIWTQIYRWVHDNWDTITSVFNAIADFFTMIWNAIYGFFQMILTAIWNYLVSSFNAMYQTAITVWNQISGFFVMIWNAISLAFTVSVNAIVNFVTAAWNAFANANKILWTAVWNFFVSIWNSISNAFTAAINAIVTFATNAWNAFANANKIIWEGISAFFGVVWNAIKTTITTIVGDIVNGVQIAFNSLWNILKPIMDTLKNMLMTAWNNIWSGIKIACDVGVGLLKAAWEGIQNVMKSPVNWVIRYVINDGLLKVWNWAADLVHLGGAQPLGYIGGQYKEGGQIPGFGGGDRIPILAERGEMIVNKDSTARWGALLHMINQDKMPKFAGGGVAGGIGSVLGGAASILGDIGGAVKGTASNILGVAWDWARQGIGAGVSAMLAPIKALINGTLGTNTGEWKGLLGAIAKSPMDKIVDFIKGKEQDSYGTEGPASAGAMRWSSVFAAALKAAGENESWLQLGLQRLSQESGGNPNAINLWDANAAAGHPSKGLMQTIDSTFNAYAGPYRSRGIYDPFANIYAAIEYTQSRYGSLAAWGRPGGYASGLWNVPGDGNVMVHKGEMIVPATDADRIRSGPKQGGHTFNMTIHTNELDPRVHAADLGYELMRRI